jgi:outer membrane protein assembly factor BamB
MSEDAAPPPPIAPAVWPMIGQGPTHASRSSSKTAPNASRPTWDVSLGEVLYASPIIAGDGTIYAATEHALRAISSSGSMAWKFPLQYPVVDVPSPAIGPDGTIYVSDGLALDAVTPAGVLRWKVPFRAGVLTSPVVSPDGTIYVATVDGGLLGLSSDGSTKITLHEPQATDASSEWLSFSTAAIAPDGTLLLFEDAERTGRLPGTFAAPLEALSPDGTRLPPGGVLSPHPNVQDYPTIAANGSIYLAGRHGGLDALDVSRKNVWIGYWYLGAGGHASNLAIGEDGTTYVALHRACNSTPPPCVQADYPNGTSNPTTGVQTGMNAFGPDGTVKWSYATSDADWMISLAVASDGTLYAAGTKLYEFDATGQPAGVADVGSPCTSPIAVAEDGAAIFGAADGMLHSR